MARPADPREHGTRKGYGQHVRNREDACEPCRIAENEYQREKRAIRVSEGRQAPRPYVPRVPKVRVYLEPGLVADFLRGRDDMTIKELRAELREALDVTASEYDGDLVKASKAERNGK